MKYRREKEEKKINKQNLVLHKIKLTNICEMFLKKDREGLN